jgi:hypothetical protein
MSSAKRKNPRRVLPQRRRSVITQRGRVISHLVVTLLMTTLALVGHRLGWETLWFLWTGAGVGAFFLTMDFLLYRKLARTVADEARAVAAGEDPYNS